MREAVGFPAAGGSAAATGSRSTSRTTSCRESNCLPHLPYALSLHLIGVGDLLPDLRDQSFELCRFLLLGFHFLGISGRLEVGYPSLQHLDGSLQADHGLLPLHIKTLCDAKLVVGLGNAARVRGK